MHNFFFQILKKNVPKIIFQNLIIVMFTLRIFNLHRFCFMVLVTIQFKFFLNANL